MTANREDWLERSGADNRVNISPELDGVLTTWRDDPEHPLLVSGSDSDSSAHALRRFAARRSEDGEATIFHRAGLDVAEIESCRALWHLLCALRRVADIPQWPPQTRAGMQEVLPNWLARASAHGPLWLLIADIDAVAGLDGSIAWWPGHLPPGLCVAATARPGVCAQHLSGAGWQIQHVEAESTSTDEEIGLREMIATGVASVQAVGGLLALAIHPVDTETLAELSEISPAETESALALLRPWLLSAEPGRWLLDGPVSRQFLLRHCLPDSGARQRGLEALGHRAGPIAAITCYRQAWRPDLALEALTRQAAIQATKIPENRMLWLTEWQALQAGAVLDGLVAVAASGDAAFLLVAAELVEAAGETVPEEWLNRAAADSAPDSCARARLWLAQNAVENADWEVAAQLAEETLELSSDETVQANARHELARIAEGAGELEQAATLYENSLAVRQEQWSESSPRLLPILGNLVSVLRAAHRMERADELAHRAVRIARAHCGPTHPATATACDQLAMVAYTGSDYAAAEAGFRETLTIVRAAFGDHHPAVAAALHNLGTALDAEQIFVEAEGCYREALSIRESVYGREHEETATTLHNLAVVLDTVGKSAEAERLYRETTDIWERLYGAEHAATITSLTNLAGVLGSREAYADAEVCYRAAVEGWRRLVGEQHPNTLTTLAELGCLYADGGKVELAEPLLVHVVETSRFVLGATDAHHINSVCSLAGLWRDQGNQGEARKLLTQTLTGAERGLGLLAPSVQQLRRQLDTLDGETLH